MLNIPIPNLLNGVSQQPDNLRFNTQAEVQENMYSSIVDGLSKRPPTEHIAKITSTDQNSGGTFGSGDLFVHLIDYGMDANGILQQYALTIRNPGSSATTPEFKVFDINAGIEVPLTIVGGAANADFNAYFTPTATQLSNGMHQMFKAVSIADFTFIVNTGIVTEMDAAVSTALPAAALLWVRQGAYSAKYNAKFVRSADTAQIIADISWTTGKATVPTNATGDSVAGVVGQNFTAGPVAIDGPTTNNMRKGDTGVNGGLDGTNYSDTSTIASQVSGLFGGTTNIPQANGAVVVSVNSVNRGYNKSREGYAIYIRNTNSPVDPFDVVVSDGVGGNGLKLVYKSVTSTSDLPTIAANGMRVKVEGQVGENKDDYWVKFTGKVGTAEHTLAQGTWSETIAPGSKYKYNYKKMPWVLIKLPDNSFVLKAADGTLYNSIAGTGVKWAERGCGDDDSNPEPSFIGKTINDIFLFRGRLGFLSDESVILSETGQYFNFWRTTVKDSLDGDPIDITSAYPEITILRHAVPFAERLIVMSDKVQFVIDAGTNLTAGTIKMTPISNFEILRSCKPLLLGQEIFFPFTRGGFSGVRGMVTNPVDGSTFIAPEVSSQIPKYIKGNIRTLAGTTHENIIAVLADGDPSAIYIYKWFDAGQERIQSSWSRWELYDSKIDTDYTNRTKIKAAFWVKSSLYIIADRAHPSTSGGQIQRWNLFLEKITVEPNRKDDYSQFVTCLDRRFSAITDAAYDAVNDRTSITWVGAGTNYRPQIDSELVVVSRANNTLVGPLSGAGYKFEIESVEYTSLSTTKIWIKGDYQNVPVWVGQQYRAKYRFSTQYLRRSDGARPITLTTGRFQLRGMSLNYANSAYFKVIVTQRFTNTEFDYTFVGNILGTGQAVIGIVPVDYGSFRFPLYGKNNELFIDILNDTPFPSSLLSAELDATYESRSQRV